MSFYRDYHDKIALKAWNERPIRAFESFELQPLSPTLGAEIRGLDLRQDLSAEQIDDIRRALAEHLVLVFRDQAISLEDHKRFARHFGHLHRHELAQSNIVAGRSADPELLSWKTGPESRYTAGDAWHADVSCDEEPIAASFLHVTRSPAFGAGDTAFANAYLAYESLSEPLKQFLDGLTAVHDGAQGWALGYGVQPKEGRNFPASEHPVVPVHPVTGRKFLFVNQAFTSHIVELSREESDALLKLLFRHVERNLSFQARIHWAAGTLVAWDNWATQHHAVWDYYPGERWGARVSAVSGQRPARAAVLADRP
jgi:taurine dioxygenase